MMTGRRPLLLVDIDGGLDVSGVIDDVVVAWANGL